MSTDNDILRLAYRRDAARRAAVPQHSPPPQPTSGTRQVKVIDRIKRAFR